MESLFSSEPDSLKPLTITEVTGQIKKLLEKRFFSLNIQGEISNCRPAASGHLYFTLKDPGASLSAVMFKGKQSSLGFRPTDGQMVTVQGNVSVYPPRGSYQIICESMQLAGEGELLAMLEQRKKQLAAEGLFDIDRKQQLPAFPSRIAVITSPTGAALRDILNVLGRRNSGINLQIFPAVVQGDAAAQMISSRIEQVNRFNQADVIIIGRGGGSIEDLLAFSDEKVVRAVADSKIPLISAVGHEIDWALSDYAADLRAPTPSAAAELVTGESESLLQRIDYIRKNCYQAINDKCDSIRTTLKYYSAEEMKRSVTGRIDQMRLQQDSQTEALKSAFHQTITQKRHQLALLQQGIYENSPYRLKERGLARILNKEGLPAASTDQLNKNDSITIEMVDGNASATITEVNHV